MSISYAKDKETHGEKPSESQIHRMAQISKELEKRDYSKTIKSQNPQTIELLRRKEGDLLFYYTSSRKQLLTTTELNHMQTQAKKTIDDLLKQTQEIARVHQKGFCL